MPGRDRTGPRGEGPMTGGGFGHCGVDEQTPTRELRAAGVGRWQHGGRFCGSGRGRGRGMRRRMAP